MQMVTRFSGRSRKIMAIANQIAVEKRHDSIDTAHILLALLKLGAGTGVDILKSLNVDLQELRLDVEESLSTGNTVPSEKLPYAQAAKDVVTRAVEEAQLLRDVYVSTEHLLFGLVDVNEGVAAEALLAAGLTSQQVHDAIVGNRAEREQPKVLVAQEKSDTKVLAGFFSNQPIRAS